MLRTRNFLSLRVHVLGWQWGYWKSFWRQRDCSCHWGAVWCPWLVTFLHICKKCVVQKLQKTLGNEALMPLNPAVQCYNKIIFSPSSVYFHYFFFIENLNKRLNKSKVTRRPHAAHILYKNPREKQSHSVSELWITPLTWFCFHRVSSTLKMIVLIVICIFKAGAGKRVGGC